MNELVLCFLLCLCVGNIWGYEYLNITLDPASAQLQDFRKRHPQPIGVQTLTAGAPVDVRDTINLNSLLVRHENHLETVMHADHERRPPRIVHAKGTGAFGYFEVTHDVSKYIKADVFNGIGKKTPLVTRFSSIVQGLGGSDVTQETRGLAIKFYTKEGNLDLVGLSFPIYAYRDPIDFPTFVHAFLRNPRTNLFDSTARWDFITLRPDSLHNMLWLFSDYGIPRGFTRMDAFPIHTYEIYNKHGQKFYVKFNFRTEQGIAFYLPEEAREIGAEDPDNFTRELYNLIEQGNYPSWRLDMDVMTVKDIKHIDYNPFDVTRQWKNGTFHTVTIGRMVLNKNVDNVFKDVEQATYNPANLVPGITGPVDLMFNSRRISYRDTQNYRVGINHNKVEVNKPLYAKTYTRDGVPPLKSNMKDAPNYYPNTFNGPYSYVDEARPSEKLVTLHSNAVDLEPAYNFYNTYVRSEGHRNRLAQNLAKSISRASLNIIKRTLKLLTMTDKDLGRRTSIAVVAAIAERRAQQMWQQKNQTMHNMDIEESKLLEELKRFEPAIFDVTSM